MRLCGVMTLVLLALLAKVQASEVVGLAPDAQLMVEKEKTGAMVEKEKTGAHGLGEDVGRRAGSSVHTWGSFMMSTGSNRAGNDEALGDAASVASRRRRRRRSRRRGQARLKKKQAVPKGYICGSSSKRGSPTDWKSNGCGTGGHTMFTSAVKCDADKSCMAFNLDTGSHNTPCWMPASCSTAMYSPPDNRGDYSGRWIQCIHKSKVQALKKGKKKGKKTSPELSLQWTGDFSTAKVGLTIPVELDKTAPGIQFKSCTPPSSVLVGKRKGKASANACEMPKHGLYIGCPAINGCVTCPASHPYPSQHFESDAAAKAQGTGFPPGIRTVCKSYKSITGLSPVDIKCAPTGELGKGFNASQAFSCIKNVKSAKFLDNHRNHYAVRCMVTKHVMCAAADKYGGRACASSKEIMLDRIEKCPSDARCGANAPVAYTGKSGEKLPCDIADYLKHGGNLCASVAATG